MKLTDALDHARDRATRFNGLDRYIQATVTLIASPSGYRHWVDYSVSSHPSQKTVGIVHTDGTFQPMNTANVCVPA